MKAGGCTSQCMCLHTLTYTHIQCIHCARWRGWWWHPAGPESLKCMSHRFCSNFHLCLLFTSLSSIQSYFFSLHSAMKRCCLPPKSSSPQSLLGSQDSNWQLMTGTLCCSLQKVLAIALMGGKGLNLIFPHHFFCLPCYSKMPLNCFWVPVL